MAEYRLAALTAPEVAARLAAGAAVLLPMGSTETHGPAAPMGDHLLAEAIALATAREAAVAGQDVLVAPVLPFGGVDFFTHVPGGIALSTPTLQALLLEMLQALWRNGARRLLILNGHGGSLPAIEGAQRAMRDQLGALVPTLHLWRAVTPLLRALGGAPEAVGHGGDPVLSTALHLFPELCHLDRARPAQPAPPVLGLPVSGFGTLRLEPPAAQGPGAVEIMLPLDIDEIAPGGVQAADARQASAALGEKIVATLARAGAALVRQMKEQA